MAKWFNALGAVWAGASCRQDMIKSVKSMNSAFASVMSAWLLGA